MSMLKFTTAAIVAYSLVAWIVISLSGCVTLKFNGVPFEIQKSSDTVKGQ